MGSGNISGGRGSTPRLKVAEILKTIQGESSYAGAPCVLVRLAGCNLNCSYCDTSWAREGGRELSVPQILKKVLACNCGLVEVTGGEPLMQDATPVLLQAFLSSGLTVLLETNGSLSIENVPADVVKILDVKCPGSGQERSNLWANFERLSEHDQIKFVLTDRGDYDWARDVIRRYHLDRFQILLSPAWGRMGPADLASWMLEDNLRARMNLQIHRIIWPAGELGAETSSGTAAPVSHRTGFGKAVVLLSGGLDSTTVLAVARHEGYEVYALTFDYGQKHGIEIACAREAALRFAVAEHRVLCLDLASIAKSSLTGTGEIPKAGETPAAIPSTYVPARNLIFLSMACAWAESLGASDIFLGVSCVDYSGYPDCRPVFLNVAESVMNLATRAGVEGTAFKIHAPFLHMTKADIIRTGLKLGVDYGATHTCYDPAPDGKPCGLCDSCRLRRKAFLEVGVPDPLGT